MGYYSEPFTFPFLARTRNLNRNRGLPILISLSVIAVIVAMISLLEKQLHHYPYVVAGTPEGLTVTFLKPGRTSFADCQAVAATIVDIFKRSCPSCSVRTKQCLRELSAQQQALFTTDPLDVPSARLRGSVVTFISLRADLAAAACRESERQAAGNATDNRVTCFSAHMPRPLVNQQLPPIEASQMNFGLAMLVLSGIVSGLACYLLIRYKHLHLHLSEDPVGTGPQKFHAVAAPRIGGIALLIGLLISNLVLYYTQRQFPVENFGFMLLAVLPAFGGGLVEDIKKDVGVSSRLMLTMFAAALGAWMLGAVLPRVDIPGFDSWLSWSPLAVAFTIFAVGGVGNAVNIIDGYNGLAAGYAVLVLTAMAWVSTQVGDVFLLTSSLTMIGALLGFLVWNYPRGMIFLGDSGAYLLGFWLAEISVLLVVRHPDVSPWFPLLLLVYPVFETIFSMARRKLWQGTSPGEPDDMHLHQLVYRYLARSSPAGDDAAALTARNSAVAPRFWIAVPFYVVPALLFWTTTAWLVTLSLGICVIYVGVYFWLRRAELRNSS